MHTIAALYKCTLVSSVLFISTINYAHASSSRDVSQNENTAEENGQILRARIGVWQDDSVVVQEVSFPGLYIENGLPRTELATIQQSDDDFEERQHVDLKPFEIKDGCLCFDADDHRFAYIHTLYYADMSLRKINTVLQMMGRNSIRRDLPILMGFFPGLPSTGYVGRNVHIDYNDRIVPPFLIAHEMGHLADPGVYGYNINENDYLGVSEGFANIMAALILQQSGQNIGYYDAITIDMDVWVSRPDHIITHRDYLLGIINSVDFRAKFPMYIPLAERRLQSVIEYGIADSHEPYRSSAIFGQPLWRLAQWIGWKKVMQLTISAMVSQQHLEQVTYDTMATALVNEARKNFKPIVALCLQHAFEIRGLNIELSTQD